MSKFPCSLTRNMTSHSMENLTFHSLLRWKVIILQILATSLIQSLFERLGGYTFWAQERITRKWLSSGDGQKLISDTQTGKNLSEIWSTTLFWSSLISHGILSCHDMMSCHDVMAWHHAICCGNRMSYHHGITWCYDIWHDVICHDAMTYDMSICHDAISYDMMSWHQLYRFVAESRWALGREGLRTKMAFFFSSPLKKQKQGQYDCPDLDLTI